MKFCPITSIIEPRVMREMRLARGSARTTTGSTVLEVSIAPAADRQPLQPDAEDQLQDRGNQEVRQHDAHQDQRAQDVIRRLVLVERPETADGDADDDRQQKGRVVPMVNV